MTRSTQLPGRIGHDFGRGLGLLLLKGRSRLAGLRVLFLALFLAWIVIVVGYVWLSQSTTTLIAAARWSAAWAMDQGLLLHDWRWSVDTNQGRQRWTTQQIHQDPWHRARFAVVLDAARRGALVGVVIVLVSGVACHQAVTRFGRRARSLRSVRGRELSSDRRLARRLRRAGQASDLTIGRLPLVENTECRHIVTVGAPGTGKTEAIKHFLDRIRERGDAAIVYDISGTLLPPFYDTERGDVILNPLDRRGASWSPWAEIERQADCDRVAASIVPRGGDRDPFFGDAARALLSVCLDHLRRDPERSVEKLLDLMLNTSRNKKHTLLAGTEAAKLFAEGAERTGQSVEINAETYVRALRFLRADAGGQADFSILKFMAKELDREPSGVGRPWLWLTSRRRDHDTLQPLISCWADAAAAALLSLSPDPDRRMWIVFDELASLQALPSLKGLMAEGRKYGACVVIGLQETAQLQAAYGREDARTLLAMCGTKAIFRITEAEGARWASDVLGEAEHEEARESARYDPGSDDGTGIHLRAERQVKALVLPSEIASLPDLQCYVQLPGAWPVARTRLPDPSRIERPDMAAALMPRDDTDTAMAALRNKAASAASHDAEGSAHTPKPDGARRSQPRTARKPHRSTDRTNEPPLWRHLIERQD